MANKGNFASRKSEDTKVEAKKKIVVLEETRTLFLQNNKIPSIEGMASVLEEVMWNKEKLLWIDLSNNHLVTVDEDLASCFPLLKTLYLHGNFMMDMQVIMKFRELEHLQTLTPLTFKIIFNSVRKSY